MRKRIIIKDADFSANGIYYPFINWYNDGSKYSPQSILSIESSIGGAGIIGNNKPVNIVRIYLNPTTIADTTVKIYLGTAFTQYTGNEPALANYSITSDDVENGYADISLLSTVTPTSQQALMIYNNPGIFTYYWKNDVDDPLPLDKIPYIRISPTSIMNIENRVFCCMQYGLI